MKEVNPLSLRAGLNNLWNLEFQPKIYTRSMVIHQFIYQILYRYFTKRHFFTLVGIKIFIYSKLYYFYFHYYPTQLTSRYLKMRLREQRHVNKDYLRLYKRFRYARHNFNYKQYMSLVYTQNSFKYIFKNIKKYFNLKSTFSWLSNFNTNNYKYIKKNIN
jgi:hypothetical protein